MYNHIVLKNHYNPLKVIIRIQEGKNLISGIYTLIGTLIRSSTLIGTLIGSSIYLQALHISSIYLQALHISYICMYAFFFFRKLTSVSTSDGFTS